MLTEIHRQRVRYRRKLEILIECAVVEIVFQDAEVSKSASGSAFERQVIAGICIRGFLPVPAKAIVNFCCIDVGKTIHRPDFDLRAVLS